MGLEQIDVQLQEHMGSDEAIANAAWTSAYDKDRRDEKTAEQAEDLVRRLAKDGHGTPFESVVCRFWMRIPVFVDRQVMTHRIASHNGMSGRYRTLPEDWYSIPNDVDAICTKANSGFSSGVLEEFRHRCYRARGLYSSQLYQLQQAEQNGAITNVEYKRAREVLRSVLPTAFMVERTSIFNLRSLANFFRLRLSPHAQPEIQHLATLMLAQLVKSNVAPVAIEALQEQNWRI